MLTKLMTALSLAPSVEFLNYEDGLLAVRCKKVLRMAQTAVKLKTSTGTTLTQVTVESYDAANDVYRIKVIDSGSVSAQILAERRDQARLAKVLRVTSKFLPGFSATTEDISVGGLRLVTRGALEPGKVIPLVLELDDSRVPSLNLRAEVAWSAKKVDGSFQSGLRFQGLDSHTERLIVQYIKARVAIEKRLHTLEEVDLFDMM